MFVTNAVSADTRVVKEAATLAACGHEVTVVGMGEDGLPAREAREGFTVLRVRPDPVGRAGDGGEGEGALSLAFGLLDYTVRGLARGLRGGFDVFHAHDLVTLPLAWLAARLSGARLVYDAHELFPEISRLGPRPRALSRFLEARLIGRSDRVITVNDSIADELARRYGIARPVVLRNFPRTDGPRVSRERSPLRERAGVPPETPIVLYQGMFMAHRGLENLVLAVRGFTRAHLVLLGRGPLRGALEALAAQEGVAGRVHLLDLVPLRELLAFTAGADLGAIATRNVGLNNYYTSPNKLFEYCVAGIPVVASRFPELVKVVEGLGLGRTFDPEEPDEIARAVNALLDDPLALSRARENVGRAAPLFAWEPESAKLVAVYDSLGDA